MYKTKVDDASISNHSHGGYDQNVSREAMSIKAPLWKSGKVMVSELDGLFKSSEKEKIPRSSDSEKFFLGI